MLVGDVGLSRQLIAAAMAVHSELGPGLLEALYSECLAHELGLRGIGVRREVAVPVRYRGRLLEKEYRLDLVVEDRLVVEVKATDVVNRTHRAQVHTYLRLAGLRVGLLLNFNVVRMADGVQRVLNGGAAERG